MLTASRNGHRAIEHEPPNDRRAEENLIAAIVAGSQGHGREATLAAAAEVKAADFYDAATARLFHIVVTLAERGPIDAAELKREYDNAILPGSVMLRDEIDFPTLAKIFAREHDGANAKFHAKRIRDAAIRRRALDFAHRLAQEAHHAADVSELAGLVAEGARAFTERAGGGGIAYRRITSEELDASTYDLDYLIEGVLVAGQPCIVAGPKKGLKTSLLIDMAIALASGGHFLGYFPCSRSARVGVMSGESGMATIQETARRICRAAGIRLSDAGVIWSDSLPKFGDAAHLEAIRRFVEADALEVLAIDPAYLAMPSADAGNLFAQGELLRNVAEVCGKAGCTLLLAHHAKKGIANPNAPPELEDMAWSGFQEFARQWLLVGRREAYQPGTGEHRLWLSVGGSAGHSGLYGVDVAEGLRTDPEGRRWEVCVMNRDQAEEARQEQHQQQQQRRQRAAVEDEIESIREAFRSLPDSPHTKTAVMERTGGSGKGKATTAAWAEMLRTGEIICHPGALKGGNNKPVDGYQLRHEK